MKLWRLDHAPDQFPNQFHDQDPDRKAVPIDGLVQEAGPVALDPDHAVLATGEGHIPVQDHFQGAGLDPEEDTAEGIAGHLCQIESVMWEIGMLHQPANVSVYLD